MPPTRLLNVWRAMTDTPLARDHQRSVARGTARPHKAVPWHKFDRSRYPEAALALAFDTNRKLAAGEYGAVAVFSQIAASLTLEGAPFDLIASASRTAHDEMRHAEFALRMAALCYGHEIGVRVDRNALEQPKCRPASIDELDLLMIEIPVLGETMASALLMASHERARDPVARAMVGSLLADEVHHARLGWYYLAWRAPRWTRAQKQRVANRAGEIVATTETRFWTGRDAPPKAKKAADALAVLDTVRQRAAVKRVMEDEIVPALDAIGLGAAHAWRARQRGKGNSGTSDS